MRIRSVKPEFWKDPDSTGRWPLDLRCFYVGMWCLADDQGRFQWVPDLIAAELFPLTRDVDVAGLLERLAATGCAMRYEVDGRAYGWLPTFATHQKIDRPTRSRLPEPPAGLSEASVRIRRGLDEASTSTRGGLVAGSRDLGSKGTREQGGVGEETKSPASPPAAAPLPAKKARRGTSPEATALREQLLAAYRQLRGEDYGKLTAGDNVAVLALLAHPPADVVRRWRIGLALGSKYPGTSTIRGLASRWRELGAPAVTGTFLGAAPVSSDFSGPDNDPVRVFGEAL